MAKTKKSVSKAAEVKISETSAVPKKEYTIEIYMAGRKDKQTGETIYEALSKLKYQKVTGVVSMTASNGTKTTKPLFLRPIFFRRALENNTVRKMLEGKAKSFLGEK